MKARIILFWEHHAENRKEKSLAQSLVFAVGSLENDSSFFTCYWEDLCYRLRMKEINSWWVRPQEEINAGKERHKIVV